MTEIGIYEHADPMQIGALGKMIALRRALQVGRTYKIRQVNKACENVVVRMKLVKKYSRYALFRVEGRIAPHMTCFGYYALLQEIGSQVLPELAITEEL